MLRPSPVPEGSGALVDSIAGAILEGRVEWIDNDVVNLPGTAAGALAAWLPAGLV